MVTQNVLLIFLHCHPLVPIGLGCYLARKMEFFQGRRVPVPVQLGSSSAMIQHFHWEENERADMSVKRVPFIVQLAGHLRGKEFEFVLSHQCSVYLLELYLTTTLK